MSIGKSLWRIPGWALMTNPFALHFGFKDPSWIVCITGICHTPGLLWTELRLLQNSCIKAFAVLLEVGPLRGDRIRLSRDIRVRLQDSVLMRRDTINAHSQQMVAHQQGLTRAHQASTSPLDHWPPQLWGSKCLWSDPCCLEFYNSSQNSSSPHSFPLWESHQLRKLFHTEHILPVNRALGMIGYYLSLLLRLPHKSLVLLQVTGQTSSSWKNFLSPLPREVKSISLSSPGTLPICPLTSLSSSVCCAVHVFPQNSTY